MRAHLLYGMDIKLYDFDFRKNHSEKNILEGARLTRNGKNIFLCPEMALGAHLIYGIDIKLYDFDF